MSLVPIQMQFAQDIARLILAAPSLGYDGVVGGEWWRPPAQSAMNAAAGIGIEHSVHGDNCALDLRAFRGGVYLTDSADYAALGQFWKSLGPTHFWGGDFEKKDGNHFSISPDGKRK